MQETVAVVEGPAPEPVGEEGGQLRRRSIGTLDVLVMSLAFAGPTVSIFFNSVPAVSSSGAALPLAFVVATVGVLFLANSVIEFSRKLPTSGFAYTFNSNGIGPKTGLMSGWLLLFGYALTTPMLYSAFALWASTFIQSITGVYVSWVWLFLAGLVFVILLSIRGVQQTATVSIALVAFELAVVLSLSIYIVVSGGHAHNSINFTPFSPTAPGSTWTGVFLAMIFTVMSFTGFENTAVLGEESRNPTRSIPRATLISIIVLGAYYVFTSYAEVAGFGVHRMGVLSKFVIPFSGLADSYWGHGPAYLVSIAATTALLAGVVASHNATVRVLYAMGRTRSLPSALGRTIPRWKTPAVAIVAHGVFSCVLGLALGLSVGPANVWGYLGSFMTPALILVYILVNISLYRYFRRVHPTEFSVWRHAIFPLLGTAVLILPLKSVVWPVPPMPDSLIPYVLIAWIVVGYLWIRKLAKSRPDALADAGKVWTDDV
ncbi:MAG: family permease [Acidimicrobiaceae bacterium]|nr:family permease [Acidimicrobiaceae bacterium]